MFTKCFDGIKVWIFDRNSLEEKFLFKNEIVNYKNVIEISNLSKTVEPLTYYSYW